MYLDESLKRFDVVYPACGSASSAVKLTIPELETASEYLGWIDVCKGWRGGVVTYIDISKNRRK